MHKGWKKFFILCLVIFAIGTLLSIVGLIGGGASAIANGYHFTKSFKAVENFSQEEVTEVEDFKNVKVNASASHVTFVPGKEYKVVVESSNGAEYNVSVQGETLIVNEEKKGEIFAIGLNTTNSKITIYYPKKITLESVNVFSEIGNIRLDNVKWNAGEFKTNAGNIQGKNIVSHSAKVESNLGEINVQGTFTGKTDMKVDAGDITFRGEFLGKTTIKSNLGDIKGTFTNPLSMYNYSFKVDLGDVNVNGNNSKKQEGSSEEKNRLLIKNDYGDINFTSP